MNRALLPLLLCALAACQKEPPLPGAVKIKFDTDPSVLRGAWSGTLPEAGSSGQALRLTLVPAFQDSTRYGVTGTGTLGSRAVTVTGIAMATGTTTFIRSQTSPVPPSTAALTLASSGQPDQLLNCLFYGGATWRCSTSPTWNPGFDLTKDIP